MKKHKIRLTLRSYDHKLLDDSVKQIVLTCKRTGADIVGPVPMPNRKKIFTVLRSPHVNKKSREQFQLVTHKRVLDIVSPAEQTMDALEKLSLSAGVDVEIR
jgi:small subunit ribosomal protein S10